MIVISLAAFTPQPASAQFVCPTGQICIAPKPPLWRDSRNVFYPGTPPDVGGFTTAQSLCDWLADRTFNDHPENGFMPFDYVPTYTGTYPGTSWGSCQARTTDPSWGGKAAFHELECPVGWSGGSMQDRTGFNPDRFVGKDAPNPPGYCQIGAAAIDRQKNTGGCDGNCGVKTAHPINIAIGNKYLEQTDYVGPGEFPLVFKRYYNSQGVDVGQFPMMWTSTYDREIQWFASGGTLETANALRADGRVVRFAKSGGTWVSDPDIADRLERLVDQGGAFIGWKLIAARGDEAETYNASGKLVAITNRAGLTQSLSYDSLGRLATVTDHFGRSLTFTYQPTFLNRLWLATMTDPAGGLYTFGYNSAQQLTSVTYPDTKVRTYLYDSPTWWPGLAGIRDENNDRHSTYTYNADGLTLSSELSGGVERVTIVNFFGGSIEDALNVTRTFEFTVVNGVKRLASISQPCNHCEMSGASQSFDANGNVSSRTDWKDNRTNYTYDLGRNLETSRTEGLTSGGGATPHTRTITTAWHSSFRLATQIAEPLRITTNVYDADGTQCGARGALCSRTLQATADTTGAQGLSASSTGLPRTWTYTYNANGSVLSVNGPRTDVSDVTTYSYYANNDPDAGKRGNVATISNAAGHVTSITAYNAHGQPLTIVDANAVTTTLAYDERQRLKSRTFGGETTSYDYDGVGQLTKVTLPDGSFLSYSYDSAHRLTGMQDNQGNRIAYTLDAMGNRTQEQVLDPASALAQTRSRVYSSLNRLFHELGAQNQTTEYAYDNQGNVTSIRDPLNHKTTQQYDALNRLKQVNQAVVQGPDSYTYHTSTFNVPGDQASSSLNCPTVGALFAAAWNNDPTYGAGGTYTYEYVPGSCSAPAFGSTVGSSLSLQTRCTFGCSNMYSLTASIVSVSPTDTGGTVAQYAYNGLDALTQVTDPRSLITGYTVDGLGNLTLQASPDTGNITNTYDAAGNLLTQTDAKGQMTSYAYDALNRVTLITFHDGSKQAYAYDQGTNGIGRLSGITETDASNQQTSLTQYTYETHGRMATETRTVNGVQYTVGYTYDTAGRLSGITYPSGRTLVYTFDALGRIGAISTTYNSPTQQVVSSIAYHPFGGVKSYTLGNGRAYTRNYDQDGRISSYTLGTKSFGIGYDAASRIEFISEMGNPPNSNTYGYDDLDRLTSATTPGIPYGYTYDGVGNRLTKTIGAGTETLTYSPTNNRIATLTPTSGPARSFVFDPNGATTNDGVNTYTYDVRGRMVQATSVIGASNYQLNALGQRIRKTNSQGDSVFHYDSGGRLIAETTAGGTLKREIIYLGDIPVAVIQ